MGDFDFEQLFLSYGSTAEYIANRVSFLGVEIWGHNTYSQSRLTRPALARDAAPLARVISPDFSRKVGASGLRI